MLVGVPELLIINDLIAGTTDLHGLLPSPRTGFDPGITSNIRVQLGRVTQIILWFQYGQITQIIFGFGLLLGFVKLF